MMLADELDPAVLTLILTAPIHCRGSFGEQVLSDLWVITFSAKFHFWLDYFFKALLYSHYFCIHRLGVKRSLKYQSSIILLANFLTPTMQLQVVFR